MKQTSIAAYNQSRAAAEKHRIIIINVLKQAGKPMSTLQISTKCYLSYHQVARRMKELEDVGKVIDSQLKAVNPSGRSATMYKLQSEQLELELK
jgi:predicted ArsR family transcriptional regulator